MLPLSFADVAGFNFFLLRDLLIIAVCPGVRAADGSMALTSPALQPLFFSCHWARVFRADLEPLVVEGLVSFFLFCQVVRNVHDAGLGSEVLP